MEYSVLYPIVIKGRLAACWISKNYFGILYRTPYIWHNDFGMGKADRYLLGDIAHKQVDTPLGKGLRCHMCQPISRGI